MPDADACITICGKLLDQIDDAEAADRLRCIVKDVAQLCPADTLHLLTAIRLVWMQRGMSRFLPTLVAAFEAFVNEIREKFAK